MPRRKLIRTNKYPYHVVNRANNKEWFKLELKDVWRIVEICLKKSYEKYPFNLIDFVLMNNHYHMIIQTPNENIDKVMFEFNRNFSLHLRNETQRINRMFGGRYKWSLIKSEKSLLRVKKYLYQNPLKAKMIKRVEYYNFSTLSYRFNNDPFIIPLNDQGLTIKYKDDEFLDWLNQLDIKEHSLVKKNLKKESL